MAVDSCVAFPIEGRQITQLRFDYAFGLEIDDENGQFSIRVNTSFSLSTMMGSAKYDPEQILACGPVLRLFSTRVISAKAFKSGRLEIQFSDGSLLGVDSDLQFEAWEAVSSDGMRAVAIPGGDLAIWQSQGDTEEKTSHNS